MNAPLSTGNFKCPILSANNWVLALQTLSIKEACSEVDCSPLNALRFTARSTATRQSKACFGFLLVLNICSPQACSRPLILLQQAAKRLKPVSRFISAVSAL
mmetsp:Transcript_98/g.124  ORF Transcript_98/g.124 Transcript_98/m.124 type:complete len:102 (-) Transcript_98:431-736(-)